MPALLDDSRFALRLLRKSPAVSAIAIFSLALGIGGTSAVFSLLDTLLLRPLPAVGTLRDLVAVVGVHARERDRFQMLSYADYLAYAGSKDVFNGLAAAADCDLTLVHRGPAERVSGLAVSGNYFEVLHLSPAKGRLLAQGDEHAPVAVMGYGLWRRAFGGDTAAIGSVVKLNGKAVTIVGIAPEGFAGTDLSARREIWVPLGAYSEIASGILVPFSGKRDRAQEWLNVFGRLSPGTNLSSARAALEVMAGRLAAAYPATNRGRSVRLVPLTAVVLGPGGRALPLVETFAARLLVVVVILLAVAAMNVAGLLLARAIGRRREIAIRLSLGASRGRLIQQLAVEALALAVLGGVAGIAVARAGLPLLERMELPVSLVVREIPLSGRVLVFALFLSFATCIVFALFPVLQAARTEVVPALRGEMPALRRQGVGIREILASMQLGAAFIIVVAAGLFLRTLVNLWAIPPGFDPTHVLAATLDVAPAGYKGTKVTSFYRELTESLALMPGVVDASIVSALPVMGADLEVDLGVSPADAPPHPGGTDGGNAPAIRHVLVGAHYFRTVRMKILRGRDFGQEDGPTAPGAIILNESAARRLWPGQDALGRRVFLAQTPAPFTVVGLVSDTTYANLKEERRPVLYFAHTQSSKSFIGDILAPQMTLLVRVAGEPRAMLGAVRDQVRALDPRLPVFRATTLDDLLAATVGVERQAAVLYAILALVAVALAMLGLVGVLLRSVSERRREFGVRVACGATPADVWLLVLGRSLALVACGVLVGTAVAAPASRLVADQLYRVRALDPATWCLSSVVVLFLALVVSAQPAARAAAIDPVAAMKSE
jgi:putative ABC transport system permease protein